MAEDRQVEVCGGVDTHRDVHVAAVVDTAGRVLGSAPFPADKAGYEQLGDWLGSHGSVARVGIEGTGSYGAGLTRHLISIGIQVVEVNRPNRQLRRRFGKTDVTDAEAAARAALNGQATGLPKGGNGPVEAIRMLSVARRSAIKARTQAINQIHALVVTAPDQVKHHLWGLSPQSPRQGLRRVSSRNSSHHHQIRQTSPPFLGPPLPNTHRRDQRVGHRDPSSLHKGQPRAAGLPRSRHRHGRHSVDRSR